MASMTTKLARGGIAVCDLVHICRKFPDAGIKNAGGPIKVRRRSDLKQVVVRVFRACRSPSIAQPETRDLLLPAR